MTPAKHLLAIEYEQTMRDEFDKRVFSSPKLLPKCMVLQKAMDAHDITNYREYFTMVIKWYRKKLEGRFPREVQVYSLKFINMYIDNKHYTTSVKRRVADKQSNAERDLEVKIGLLIVKMGIDGYDVTREEAAGLLGVQAPKDPPNVIHIVAITYGRRDYVTYEQLIKDIIDGQY